MADPEEMTEDELPQDDMYSSPWETLPTDTQPGYDPENPNAIEWDFSGVSVEGEPLKTHDAIKAPSIAIEPFSTTVL